MSIAGSQFFGQPRQRRAAEPGGRYNELKQKVPLNLKSDHRQPLGHGIIVALDEPRLTTCRGNTGNNMIYEHYRQPLISRTAFFLRILLHVGIAVGIVVASLALGIIGYHIFEGLSWIDSTVNAAMILGGMGPVNQLYTNAGKLFAAFYALFSGIVFLVAVAVMLAPVAHRLLHRFHIEFESEGSTEG